jgi:hypothetical protein
VYVGTRETATLEARTGRSAWFYPDGLAPLQARTSREQEALRRGRRSNQPVWVDVFVPQDTCGATGTVSVTAAERSLSVPLSLTAWDFELPLRPSLKSRFGLQWPSRYLDRDCHEVLLDHKVAPEHVRISDVRELVGTKGLAVSALRFSGTVEGCQMDAAPSVADLTRAAASYPPEVELYVYVADEIEEKSCLFEGQNGPQRPQTQAKALVTMPPT